MVRNAKFLCHIFIHIVKNNTKCKLGATKSNNNTKTSNVDGSQNG